MFDPRDLIPASSPRYNLSPEFFAALVVDPINGHAGVTHGIGNLKGNANPTAPAVRIVVVLQWRKNSRCLVVVVVDGGVDGATSNIVHAKKRGFHIAPVPEAFQSGMIICMFQQEIGNR